MPYQSKAQVGFMHAKHPGIAKRWDETYGVPKNLPSHKGEGPIASKLRRSRGASRGTTR